MLAQSVSQCSMKFKKMVSVMMCLKENVYLMEKQCFIQHLKKNSEGYLLEVKDLIQIIVKVRTGKFFCTFLSPNIDRHEISVSKTTVLI